VIATIEAGTGTAPAPAAIAPAKVVEAPPHPAAAAAPATEAATLSPAVRRAVLEHGIDPATVKGTGKDGRLTKEDVEPLPLRKARPRRQPLPLPLLHPPPAGTRGEERVKMTRLRQTIARRLKRRRTPPPAHHLQRRDMSAVMKARDTYKDSFEKKHGVRSSAS
jgi:2-oxoglutarate dehydrogenase E2 component (dihydrolipoamide succinyltransferase)